MATLTSSVFFVAHAVTMAGVVRLLDIVYVPSSPPSVACPPQPSALLLRDLPVPVLDLVAEHGSALVLLLPVLCSVNVPVLAESRRKGLGEQ